MLVFSHLFFSHLHAANTCIVRLNTLVAFELQSRDLVLEHLVDLFQSAVLGFLLLWLATAVTRGFRQLHLLTGTKKAIKSRIQIFEPNQTYPYLPPLKI